MGSCAWLKISNYNIIEKIKYPNKFHMSNTSLIDERVNPLLEPLISAILFLFKSQNDDGGWGPLLNKETDVFPTYLVIWAFHEALHYPELRLPFALLAAGN